MPAHRPARSRTLARAAAAALAAVTLAALVACSVNPATGQRQFNVLSRQQEIRLGEEASPQFLEQGGGELPDPEVVRYVRDLGQRLAEISERPALPWEFHVLDSSVINARPGGKVFITRGLIEKMENEAQLAGVLGHEIGHVTAQHIGQQMSQSLLITGIGVGIGIAGEETDEDWLKVLGAGTAVGGNLYLLKFGRDQESQADTLGLRYMTKLGYNPVAQVQVMRILKQASGAAGGIEFLSTHPLPDTRIERLEEQIREQYPRYDDPAAYSFHADRFQQRVLDPLAKLPPAQHPPANAQPAN